MPRVLPFRTRILAVVLVGGLVPLLVVGLWLTRSAARSGEALLRRRLEATLDRAVLEIGSRWVRERADLVSFSEHPDLVRWVDTSPVRPPANVLRASFSDSTGTSLWTADARSAEGETALPVGLAVFDRETARPIGTLALDLKPDAVLGELPAVGSAFGALIAAFDRVGGASLLALPYDPALLDRDRFQWGGEEWLARRRGIEEPPLTLVAAAPVTPFALPFQEAARTGTGVLALVALASFGLAALLTFRLTRRLGHLAGAADAVALGDLDQRLEPGRADEVGRVARAFNAMTESLRRTLGELAQRQALASVGEFAAGLAHEIRNPLTAIRLDLQRVEEELPPASPARPLQERALREVDRLDRAVSGALRIARSGRITRALIHLRTPLQAAFEAATPEFAGRGAILEPLPADLRTVVVPGDPAALEQVFLNLLLNAAQALERGGRARVEMTTEPGRVHVAVRDEGPGIAAARLETVFDPFFSTKPGGTGLGLSIARQIVLAHGGAIAMESMEGHGTTVRVTLPASTHQTDPP